MTQVVTQTQKMRLRPIAHNQSRDKTEQSLIVDLKTLLFCEWPGKKTCIFCRIVDFKVAFQRKEELYIPYKNIQHYSHQEYAKNCTANRQHYDHQRIFS